MAVMEPFGRQIEREEGREALLSEHLVVCDLGIRSNLLSCVFLYCYRVFWCYDVVEIVIET